MRVFGPTLNICVVFYRARVTLIYIYVSFKTKQILYIYKLNQGRSYKFLRRDFLQFIFQKPLGFKQLLDLKSVYQNRSGVVNWQSEIDFYIESPCANKDVDILTWWRDHENVYPILAKMAKDLLSVMATSVPVERLFSNTAQIMVPRRRTMKNDIFQALGTISSWIKSDLVYDICGFTPKIL